MEGLPIKSQTEGIMFHVSPLLFPASPVHFFFTWRGLCLDFPALALSLLCSYSRGKVFNVMLFKFVCILFHCGSPQKPPCQYTDHDSLAVVRPGSREEICFPSLLERCRHSRAWCNCLQTEPNSLIGPLHAQQYNGTCVFQRNTQC